MKSRTKDILIVVLCITIVFLISGVVYAATQSRIEETKTQVATLDIQGKVNDIGELATSEYGFTITNVVEKPNKEIIGFKIPLTASEIMYSYDGLIKAGIDFNEIEINVNDIEKKIFVKLPDLEILSSEIDNNSLVIYDEHYSTFNKVTFSDINLAIIDVKKTAVDSAIANGLLERAEVNAKNMISSTILSLNNENNYGIEYYK